MQMMLLICFLKKPMEINPYHPIIKSLLVKVQSDKDAEDKSLIDTANLLYDAALLVSGFHHKEPSDFANRIHRVIAHGLDIDPNATVDEEPEPTPKPKTESSSDDTPESADFSHDEAAHDEL